ncbi:MAG: hypothetical protein IJW06_07440 [Clostridia bacterium]|nr:hypothetical protein [Clostridia bacterium]
MAKTPFREKPQDIHANNLQVLKERIKAKTTEGCYIFYGDEEYTKNHYTNLILSQAGSNLNVTSIYGDEFSLENFIASCETSAVESLDMFSIEEKQDEKEASFRIIKLYYPDLSGLSKKDSDYLLEFLQNLPEKTIVIFWFYMGDDDTVLKGSFYKKVSEFALTVNFKREPVGSSVLVTWVLRHFSREKLNVDRHVAVHLCQTVGNSMTDLKNEIDKLIGYLRFENRDTLEISDVDFICIKSTSAQIFDISSGALSGNFTKAARALNVLRDKRESPILILGTISKAINDLCRTDICIKRGIPVASISKETGIADFIVKNSSAYLTSRNRDFKGKESFPRVCAELCLEYDKKIKSSRTDGYELLLELIFKLSFAGKSVS